MAGAPVPSAKYQQLVSTMSAPARHGAQDGRQTVTRRAVGVEIDRYVDVLFEQLDQPAHAHRRNQARHVLDRNHVGAECCHLFRLVEEVGVGKDRTGFLLPRESREESRFGVFRIDRIADRAIGDAAVLLDVFDGRFHVVHVVQCIEDTHDAQAALDGIAAESVDDLVGIGGIPEEVAAARERGQFRYAAHGFVDRFEPRPRVFVQIPHHRIGHGAAPYFHRVEIRVLVVG